MSKCTIAILRLRLLFFDHPLTELNPDKFAYTFTPSGHGISTSDSSPTGSSWHLTVDVTVPEGGTCPPYSVAGTFSTTQSYATCAMYACGGNEFTVSVCGSFTGDTYLRLVDGTGYELASNDDKCGRGSAFTVQIPHSYGCGTFNIREGCYGSGACSGTVTYTSKSQTMKLLSLFCLRNDTKI